MRSTVLPVVRALTAAVFVGVLLSGCGDSSTEPDGLTLDDLVGSWGATSAVFTNNANSSQKVDIVALGGELNVTVLTQGRARTWLTVGEFYDEWDAQLSLNGNQLTSTPAESSRRTRHYTIAFQGDTFTMTSDGALFDFTLADGPPVSATEVIVFARR